MENQIGLAERANVARGTQTLEAAIGEFKSFWDTQHLSLAKQQPKIDPVFMPRPIQSSVETIAELEFGGDISLARGVVVYAGLPILRRFLDESGAGQRLSEERSRRPDEDVIVHAIDVSRYMSLMAYQRPLPFSFRCLLPEDTAMLQGISQDFAIPSDIVVFLATVAGLAQATYLLPRGKVRAAKSEMLQLQLAVISGDLEWMIRIVG